MRFESPEELRFEEAGGKRLLAALSGGADSVALVCLLADRRRDAGFELSAAHFNHGLRGAEADADEAFCRALCEALGIAFYRGGADVRALAQSMRCGIETAARKARYDFLYRTADACGAELIVLAHHADDQAETVLMHILRGAGTGGAGGMARLSGRLYRPLLGVPKAALTNYLRARGQSWREDASNAEADNPRNALRLEILPALTRVYPAAVAALGRFADNARADDDCLEGMTRAFMTAQVDRGPYGIRIRDPQCAHEAVLRRALRALIDPVPDKAQCDRLLALASARRGRQKLNAQWMAERTAGALYLIPERGQTWEEVPFVPDGVTLLRGICRITSHPGTAKIVPGDASHELVDAAALEGAVLRTRRAGDRISLPGTSGSMLLSDRFTDRKLDRPLRNCVPVLAKGSTVLWAWGEGLSRELRVGDDARARLCLTIELLYKE